MTNIYSLPLQGKLDPRTEFLDPENLQIDIQQIYCYDF